MLAFGRCYVMLSYVTILRPTWFLNRPGLAADPIMPVSDPASSTLVPKALPIHKLGAQIDGTTESLWLPPNKLPPGGAFVHVSECPDRLANMSNLLDINNLCDMHLWSGTGDNGVAPEGNWPGATEGNWPGDEVAAPSETVLRAMSYVRPERPGLFFSKEGNHGEVLALVIPDATVVSGWPHDAWGNSATNQTTCPESEKAGEYARRRLEHFVRHCGHVDANRWWAGNFTCFYQTREAIEERQYAYLDLLKQNGTTCPPGQLHNQIMVRWEPDKITRILHSRTAFAAAHRLRNVMPVRQLWEFEVTVSPLLERCDKCCQEPHCPNPLLKAATGRSRKSVGSSQQKTPKQRKRARRQQIKRKQKLRKLRKRTAQKRTPAPKAPKRALARQPRAARRAARRRAARWAEKVEER